MKQRMGCLRSFIFVLSLIGSKSFVFAQTKEDTVKNIDSVQLNINGKSAIRIEKWRNGQPNGFLGIRSNAPHWWSYFKVRGDKYFDSAWIVNGVVIGDTHMFNMGTIIGFEGENEDKYLLRPIDLDDSGLGATISDIARYITSERMNPDGLSVNEILNYYEKGLRGETIKYPRWLEKILNTSQQEVQKQTSKYLTKKTKSNLKLDNNELKVIGSSWEENIENEWTLIKEQLDTKFHQIEILDVGYRTRTTGGIQGMARFFVLAKANGKLSLLEIKEVSEPAVALWTMQPSFEDRHKMLSDTLAGSPVLASIQTESKKYIVRNKNQEPIEDELENADTEKIKDWSRIVSYELGRLHNRTTRSSHYTEIFIQNKRQITDSIIRYSTDYLKSVSLTPLR